MTSALMIQGLEKRYKNGVKAISGVDLEIASGEFFAILGPNGAGKSTLINIVAQVVSKSAGTVEVFGVSIDRHPQEAKMLLGFTPQEVALDPFFTVLEVLQNHSGYYGLAHNQEWIATIMQRLGLEACALRTGRQLSGGMKRRLSIAKALVHRPKLLILDEPTAGVDVALRHALWAFIRELHALGTTILLTTHYLEEAQQLAGRVAILRDGAVVACDRTEQLLRRFGTRRFEVVVTEDSVGLPFEGCQRSSDGKRIVGEFCWEQSASLFAWLSQEGERLEDVRITEASLEEVFLRLTE
ncbi:MAG: ABC transporter ATP-binding protein [Magnetococcus sp. DMHC-6]